MKAIRDIYDKLGVDKYYRKHAADYQNPHFAYIQQLLRNNRHRISYQKVLDLSCGRGEVSKVLMEMGFHDQTGCHPYTHQIYKKEVNKPCYRYNFEDIIRGKLSGQYDSIICSFAMHLCPPKQLYPLTHRLFDLSKQLVIITPHKRPQLENINGIEFVFEDYVCTERGKKVRLKVYNRSTPSNNTLNK